MFEIQCGKKQQDDRVCRAISGYVLHGVQRIEGKGSSPTDRMGISKCKCTKFGFNQSL